MSAEPARHLKPVSDSPPLIVVNPETGERVGFLDDHTRPVQDTLDTLTNKYQAACREITNLKRNKEAEARAHKSWEEAEAMHIWYALATGHEGTKFEAEEFFQALPRLRERNVGPVGFLQAIAGVAFDPKKSFKPQRNGRFTLYDSWEHLTRNRDNMQSYRDRAPGDPDGHEWKRWLLDHIESQWR